MATDCIEEEVINSSCFHSRNGDLDVFELKGFSPGGICNCFGNLFCIPTRKQSHMTMHLLDFFCFLSVVHSSTLALSSALVGCPMPASD